MHSFHQIELFIKAYATLLPLDMFVFIGSFFEEIIPPIPAPLVMTTAGSLLLPQGHGWIFLLWLAVAGSLGKLFASWIYYVLGDKFEDVVVGKYGKFIGINHKDVESIGKKFQGGWGDDISLFLFRAVPIFPSVSVSIVCGIIRLRMRSFLVATFFGTVVKNLLYLYAGYGGIAVVGYLSRRIHSAHFWINFALVLVFVVSLFLFVRKSKENPIK
jgi:membrane protein DedA with SNARE-associated domain